MGTYQETRPATFFNNQLTYPNPSQDVTISNNAKVLLNTGIIPLPNATTGCSSTGAACYDADISLPTYWREELFRIDQTLSPNWQAAFRYIHDEWDQTSPVPQYAFTQNSLPIIQNRFNGPGLSVVARLTGAFSPSLLNEFVASYTDSYLTIIDIPASGVSLTRPSQLSGPCPAQAPQCPLTTIFDNNGAGTNGVPKFPGVNVAGNNADYGGLGYAIDPGYMPWQHTNPSYSFADNLTKTVGRHNLQFGAEWIIFQFLHPVDAHRPRTIQFALKLAF